MYSIPHGKEDFMAGSIEKRGDNTYRLVYFCGKNLDGSPARHTKTVHCTKKEANHNDLLLGGCGGKTRTYDLRVMRAS